MPKMVKCGISSIASITFKSVPVPTVEPVITMRVSETQGFVWVITMWHNADSRKQRRNKSQHHVGNKRWKLQEATLSTHPSYLAKLASVFKWSLAWLAYSVTTERNQVASVRTCTVNANVQSKRLFMAWLTQHGVLMVHFEIQDKEKHGNFGTCLEA